MTTRLSRLSPVLAAVALLGAFNLHAEWGGGKGAAPDMNSIKFDDPSIWTEGYMPALGKEKTEALVTRKATGDATFVLTNDFSWPASRIAFKVNYQDKSLGMNGNGYTFVMPDPPEGTTYNRTPVSFAYRTTGIAGRADNDYPFASVCMDAAETGLSPLKWTNPVWRLRSDANQFPTLTFEKGAYNFYDPAGTALKSILRFNYEDSITAAQQDPMTVIVCPGVKIDAYQMYTSYSVSTNVRTVLDGATLNVHDRFYSQSGDLLVTNGANVSVGVNFLAYGARIDVRGSKVAVAGDLHQLNGGYLRFDDQSELVAAHFYRRPGAGPTRIRNSRVTLGVYGQNYNGNEEQAGSSYVEILEGAVVTNTGITRTVGDATLIIKDGAIFHSEGNVTVGHDSCVRVSDGASLTSSGNLASNSKSTFALTGGATASFSKVALNGSTNLIDGVGTVLNVGTLEANINSPTVVTNGAVVLANSVTFAGSGARLEVGTDAVVSNRTGAVSLAGKQAIVVNGGTFVQATGSMFTIAGDALVEVNGGYAELQKSAGSDCLVMGQSGAKSTVRVNGGTCITGRARLGRFSTPTAGGESLIEVNGGLLKMPGAVIFFQGQNNDNVGGSHALVLNGGVAEVSSIYAETATGNNTAKISGDGGTLRTTSVTKIGTVECGAKGLTVDSRTSTTTLNCDLKSKDGEDGLLRTVGTGTVKIVPQGGAWTLAKAEVAEGTLLLNANLSDGARATSLTIDPLAVFSLQGSATSLTVAGFAATNATLKLDPGDVIHVTGKLAISGLKLDWSAVPSETESFLVVDGELDDEQKSAIRRLYYENVIEAGKHAEFSVEYDEQSGTTTVKTKVADDTPLAETAVWTGSGAWATAENWQESVKPTEMKKAVFGADAVGKEVEIAAGDFAGALSFTGGSYRLFGETLAIEGYPGAAEIDVTEGSHVVDAPLELMASLPVKLASGAELALNGRIDYGGLDKSGRGHLTLGGTLALDGQGFISRDGLVTVTNATALGATSEDIAKFAAGTLEFAHPDGEPMEIAAAVSGAAETTGKTTLVFKVESDATLKNFENANSRLLKRGAGVLTLDFDEAKTIAGWMSADLDTTSNLGCTYPADGSEPSGYRFPVCIAEGEVKLVGRGSTPITVTSHAKTLVGVPTKEAKSSAAILTLDNVKFVSSDYLFYIGYQTGSTTYKNRKAIVRILNGSTLQVGATVVVGYSSSYSNGRCQVAVTNGTYRIVAVDGSLSRGGLSSGLTCNVEYLMDNSSFIVKTSIVTDGSTYMDADNGSYFGGENRTPMVLKYNNQNHARIYGELYFHNGSTLALSGIVETTPTSGGKRTRDLVFAFDDAEWIYDAACGDKTWPVAVEGHNKYEMRGRGVILKPAAGKTFETLEPFIGAGGVVNAGEGTVKFGEGAYQCAGTLEITETAGTIDVSADDGTSHAVIPVKGKGTLKGAKTTRLVVKADAEDDWTGIAAPTLLDCSAGTVVIDMGRTAEKPMSDVFPQNVAVAKWTGTGAVPAFRLRNTGLRNVGADFSVDPDGTVRMTPHETGIVLIVR